MIIICGTCVKWWYLLAFFFHFSKFWFFGLLAGMEIMIFSGVKLFCRNFLNFIFNNIFCNNNLYECGKLILHADWCTFGNFEGKGKVHFLKCERKTNITLIYALYNLLNNVHFHNCKNFWDFTNTFFLLWAQTME